MIVARKWGIEARFSRFGGAAIRRSGKYGDSFRSRSISAAQAPSTNNMIVYYGGRLENSEVLMGYRVTLTRAELKALTRAATKTTGKRFLYCCCAMDRGPGGRGAGRLGPHGRALETAVCGAGVGVRLGAQAAGAAAAESDLRRRVRGSPGRLGLLPGPAGAQALDAAPAGGEMVELGWVERVSVMTVQKKKPIAASSKEVLADPAPGQRRVRSLPFWKSITTPVGRSCAWTRPTSS